MYNLKVQLALAKMLVTGLERLSADSHWAHQASGLRGSLLKLLDQAEKEGGLMPGDEDRLVPLVEQGFTILENAAREISA